MAVCDLVEMDWVGMDEAEDDDDDEDTNEEVEDDFLPLVSRPEDWGFKHGNRLFLDRSLMAVSLAKDSVWKQVNKILSHPFSQTNPFIKIDSLIQTH